MLYREQWWIWDVGIVIFEGRCDVVIGFDGGLISDFCAWCPFEGKTVGKNGLSKLSIGEALDTLDEIVGSRESCIVISMDRATREQREEILSPSCVSRGIQRQGRNRAGTHVVGGVLANMNVVAKVDAGDGIEVRSSTVGDESSGASGEGDSGIGRELVSFADAGKNCTDGKFSRVFGKRETIDECADVILDGADGALHGAHVLVGSDFI